MMSMEEKEETLSVLGIPIPPSKIAEMGMGLEKNSREYQEITWKSLKMVIDDLVRSVDSSNLKQVVAELFAENIIRGKGMFCNSCMKYQMISPEKTVLYAALVALVDNHFPAIGDLLVRRLFKQFILLLRKYDKDLIVAVTKFIVHLMNFHVLCYWMGQKYIVKWCLDKGTSEYVECAVEFFKELNLSGNAIALQCFQGVPKHFQKIIEDGQLDQDVLDVLKDVHANWDSRFETLQPACPELDWVKKERHRGGHFLSNFKIPTSIFQEYFMPDPLFLEREIAYETFKRLVLLEGYWQCNVEKKNKPEWRKHIRALWHNADPERCSNQLLQIIEPGEEMQFSLFFLEECVIEDFINARHIRFVECLCKNNVIFEMSLAKCFLLVWWMIPGLTAVDACIPTQFFAELLLKDLVSWHVLAYVQFSPQDITGDQWDFIKSIFMKLKVRLTKKGLLEKLLDPSLRPLLHKLAPVNDSVAAHFAFKHLKKMGLHQVVQEIKRSRNVLAEQLG